MNYNFVKKNKPNRKFFNYGLIYLLGAICILFILAPIFLMFSIAFKSEADVFSSAFSWFFVPTLSNFSNLFDIDQLSNYFLNSCIVTISSTFFSLFIGALSSYVLSNFSFRGRNTILFLLSHIRVVPLVVLAIPIYILWSDLGLSNSLFGLSIMYAAINLPIVIWILFPFYQAIPKALEEAALIDGCTYWQVFYKIFLPISLPGMVVAGIFSMRIAWNDFILAFVVSDVNTRTLSAFVSLFITDVGVQWGQIMSLGVLMSLPSLVVILFLSRYIVQGFVQGAVK